MSETIPARRGRPARIGKPRLLSDVVQGVGWFSLALGAAELVAPDLVAKTLGMKGKERLIQSYGAREIVSGFGILASRDPAPWLWGRLFGDVMDVATLRFGKKDKSKADNVTVAVAALLGVALLDLVLAASVSGRKQIIRSARPNYRGRIGFPGGTSKARGAASDFVAPDDFRIPPLLRPFDYPGDEPSPE